MSPTPSGSGTKDDPWMLKTLPGTSEYQMYRRGPGPTPILSMAGTGSAGVPRPLRHVRPPLLEHLGRVDVEHNPKNNRIRARA